MGGGADEGQGITEETHTKDRITMNQEGEPAASDSKANRLDESDAGVFDRPGQEKFSSDEEEDEGDK